MSIHAVGENIQNSNVIIEYRDRLEGSKENNFFGRMERI